MDIKLACTAELAAPKTECDILVLLPKKEVDSGEVFSRCEAFAKESGLAVAVPPFTRDGYVMAALVTPEESCLQPACFLPAEMQKEYRQGEDVKIFPTRWGSIALAAGLDILQPQYARTAALCGARLLFAALWQDTDDYIMAGPWAAAQGNCMAVSVAGAAGGRLILPCECTQDKSGLGRTAFNTEELQAAYRMFPIFDCLNPALYAHYKEALLQ